MEVKVRLKARQLTSVSKAVNAKEKFFKGIKVLLQ